LDAYTLPVTRDDVANTFVESFVSPNPVIAVLSIGLTPRFSLLLVAKSRNSNY